MSQSIDQIYASRKVFQDYCNKRDQLRVAAEWPDATLTTKQEQIVLSAARLQFRQRESMEFKRWLGRFFSEANHFLVTTPLKYWPIMRTK